MKTIYSYFVVTDGMTTWLKDGRRKIPFPEMKGDGEKEPAICAKLLRCLAKWAVEQAEIIEELDSTF